MAELDDERIRFYLRHRAQIEAWAGLRSEAALAIDGLLDRFAEDVQNLAADLGSDVAVRVKTEGEAYPHFLLHRESWALDPLDPRAAVGLEWVRGKTFLDGIAAPYVGVRFAISDDETRLLRNRFRDAAQVARASRGDKATPWWPCLSYVPAGGEFWADFGPYRERLLGALRGAWEAYAGTLDGVVVGGAGAAG